MKATEEESKKFDKALDVFLELFNNLENDTQIVEYSDEVADGIEKAKKKYGTDVVNEKINTVIGEMISWLDLDDVEE